MNRTVTITAERSPGGFWILEADGIGVSQVRRLDQAIDEMTEPIETMLGVDISEVDVQVVPMLPETYTEERNHAESARSVAVEATSQAAMHSRRAARILADMGLSIRDVGQIMGISHQRAAKLISTSPADEGQVQRLLSS